jgi:AcrR family transcriptional regulator
MASARAQRRNIGRPRLVSGVDAREQLLDATVTLFAEQGIAGTTIAQIAARVGVTTAMVHYYFKDRDRLVQAIARERVLRVVLDLWSPVVHETDVSSLIRGFVARLLRASELNPWLPSLWLREIVSEGGELRPHLRKLAPTDPIRHVIKTVKAAQRRGEIDGRLEPRLAIASVIGVTLLPLAVIRTWKQVPEALQNLTREDIARHAQALLANAFAKPIRRRLTDERS